MERRFARLPITGPLFRQMFCEQPPGQFFRCRGLPADAEFLRLDHDPHTDRYYATFWSASFRVVPEGCQPEAFEVSCSGIYFPPDADVDGVLQREWQTHAERQLLAATED